MPRLFQLRALCLVGSLCTSCLISVSGAAQNNDAVVCEPVEYCLCKPGATQDIGFVNSHGCPECRCVRETVETTFVSPTANELDNTLSSTPVPSTSLPSSTVGTTTQPTTAMPTHQPFSSTDSPSTSPTTASPTPESTCSYIEGSSHAGISLDFRFPHPQSAVACGNACGSLANCAAYSFEAGDCTLLRTTVGLIESPPQHSSVVTGTCDEAARSRIRADTVLQCVLTYDVDFSGGDLAHNLDTVDAAGCASLCVSISECTRFTYLAGKCYPKSNATAMRAVEVDQNAVSGVCHDVVATTRAPVQYRTPPPTPRPTTKAPSKAPSTPAPTSPPVPTTAPTMPPTETTGSTSNASAMFTSEGGTWMMTAIALMVLLTLSLVVIVMLLMKRRNSISHKCDSVDSSSEDGHHRHETEKSVHRMLHDGSEGLEFDPLGASLDAGLRGKYARHTSAESADMDTTPITPSQQGSNEHIYESPGSGVQRSVANCFTETENLYELGAMKPGFSVNQYGDHEYVAHGMLDSQRKLPDASLPMMTVNNGQDEDEDA